MHSSNMAITDRKGTMDKIKYPYLFEPIILAGTYFRNRIFSSFHRSKNLHCGIADKTVFIIIKNHYFTKGE